MKNLKFKSLFAQNFLPFGPEGIKIDFDSLKNIILIKGENVDYKDANSKESSNGSGKSSIQEIIVWTLYGKTIKSPKKLNKSDVIHNIYKKSCKTEVCFDKYKIQRGRSPDYLKLWEFDGENWNEYTQGKSQDTQQRIEELIGLSYESFLITSIFTDDQANCFLEANQTEKREIIEDLLSLSVYKQRFENSKFILKENKNSLKQLAGEYEMLLGNKKSVENKIESSIKLENNWKSSKKKEMSDLLDKIKIKQKELNDINEDEDVKKYEEYKNKAKNTNEQTEINNENLKKVLEEKKKIQKEIEDLNKAITVKKDKIKNLEFDKKNKNSEIEKNKKEIESLNNQEPGRLCKTCYSKIDPDNYKEVIKTYEENNKELEKEIEKFNQEVSLLKIENQYELLKENENILKNILKKESELNNKLSDLRKEFLKYSSIKEPESNSSKKVLEKEIEMMKNEVKNVKSLYENNPYKEILDTLNKDLEEVNSRIESKQNTISDIEKQIPYYEFWVDAFGDSGIRKWIVDGIIPALNNRLDYWMQVLDDNRIKISFNNELEETICKNLEEDIEFYYYTMSAGQKRRLNLAVSQSFAHIMMLTTNTCPSICFLDEVTTNIDPVGVQGIYDMICELSEHRQMFITTHDTDLLNMLSGCDTIDLKMENGISKIKDKSEDI